MFYSRMIKVSDVKQDGYLKSLVLKEPADMEGYEKVRLGDLATRIPRAVYQLDDYDEDDRNLAYIDRSKPYYGNRWNDEIDRRPINHLFRPAYWLEKNCLVVNTSGDAEPRIFEADRGSAFFEDGYAFAPNNEIDLDWLVAELNKPYITHQLHPYGYNDMVPEPLTEDDYLNLIVYKQIINEEEEEDGDVLSDEDKARDALPAGYVIENDNKRYTILNYISCGCFGYTYRAEMLNQQNGLKEIVAIKEFYPRLRFLTCYRDNKKTCNVMCDPKEAVTFDNIRKTFRSESDFLLSMADTKDNHVTEVKTSFDYELTGTSYYVMKYYEGASLKDMIISNQVPTSEQLIIDKIVVPMCKALHVMCKHNILHLDIKPENVVIDENGEAILIDFGVAHQYDKDGKLVSMREAPSISPFSAPENQGGMKNFGAQADIFGTAATLFNLVSGEMPFYISGWYDRERAFEMMNCSDKMKEAIIEGLAEFSNDRPANAQRFLNLFPGCEDIKL